MKRLREESLNTLGLQNTKNYVLHPDGRSCTALQPEIGHFEEEKKLHSVFKCHANRGQKLVSVGILCFAKFKG